MKILYVNDDKTAVMDAHYFLSEQGGHELTALNDPSEARKIIYADEKFDAFIVDANLNYGYTGVRNLDNCFALIKDITGMGYPLTNIIVISGNEYDFSANSAAKELIKSGLSVCSLDIDKLQEKLAVMQGLPKDFAPKFDYHPATLAAEKAMLERMKQNLDAIEFMTKNPRYGSGQYEKYATLPTHIRYNLLSTVKSGVDKTIKDLGPDGLSKQGLLRGHLVGVLNRVFNNPSYNNIARGIAAVGVNAAAEALGISRISVDIETGKINSPNRSGPRK